MTELIVTGKTVDEAVESALQELGLTEEEVTVEVLELPRRRLFRSVPAKVKVIVDEVEKQAKEVKKEEVKSQPPVKKQEKKAPVKEEQTAKPKQRREDVEEVFTEIQIEGDERLEKGVSYLRDVCAKMGINDIKVSASKSNENIIIKVDGEQTGALIGHRGETMDSLGYLTNLVANRGFDSDYIKISLDVNGYRKKRHANLVVLAQRIAQKVTKTGKSHTLEPMNPYERRILHSTISEIKGVRSESVGEGNTRRVCILPENGRVKPPYDKNNSRRRNNNSKPRFNDNKNGGAPQQRQSSTPGRNFANKPRTQGEKPVAQKRTDSIKDGDNMPLYGKVDI